MGSKKVEGVVMTCERRRPCPNASAVLLLVRGQEGQEFDRRSTPSQLPANS